MAIEKSTPALLRLLAEMPGIAVLERIDRVWVFPPRRVGEVESGLVVLALRTEGRLAGDQCEVVTVQYEARVVKGVETLHREVAGRGWAPSARVPGMMAGVVRRLGGDAEEPHAASVEGDPERWNRFVAEVSERTVDPANGE